MSYLSCVATTFECLCVGCKHTIVNPFRRTMFTLSDLYTQHLLAARHAADFYLLAHLNLIQCLFVSHN